MDIGCSTSTGNMGSTPIHHDRTKYIKFRKVQLWIKSLRKKSAYYQFCTLPETIGGY
jgi:hypothetical protein